MCGIALIYQESADNRSLDAVMRDSLSSMHHRGPDGSGRWLGENVAVGHVRLSIIDVQGSTQPMVDGTGRYCLSYNGEIYNYKEIRAELKEKWEFRTEGDTEVLLAGLILYGVGFLEKLDGMWAFLLWDDHEKKLMLGRDRMGKKPLYYSYSGNNFICASELKSLSILSGEVWSEDQDSTSDYLRYGYYLPGYTAYENVREVLPGHVLTWMPSTKAILNPYWRLHMGDYQGTKDQACSDLQEALVSSVSRRMVADVEVGAFLSGGVDSSLITSIMVQKLGIRPKTFTVGFNEKQFDEREFAQFVARENNTDHYAEVLDSWNRDTLVDLVLNNIGQPFADSSILPTYHVSKLASKHVKVALSGDGGDELFSGYQRYQARSILRWYTRLPRGLRGNFEKLIKLFPEPMSHHSRSVLKKAFLFLDVANRQEAETPYVAPVNYSMENFRKLAPDLYRGGHSSNILPEETSGDSLRDMMYADALVYLPQDILLKVDRASMANSLETRAPFLAKDVVELAFTFRRTWHRRNFTGKKLLKDCFGSYLPESIWGRRKQGFAVPVHQWFREGLGEELKQMVSDSSDLPLDKGVILDMLNMHVLRARDHGYRLWNIYIYLVWKMHRK